MQWFNSVLKVFFNEVNVFTCNAFWEEISVSLVSSWSFVGGYPSLYCSADCSCSSCCCCSEIGLTFLLNALAHVSSSGAWKILWNLMTVAERSVSFSPVDKALLSAVLSSDFPFQGFQGVSKESPKRYPDALPAMFANLAYWTGNYGLIKTLLSELMDWFNLPARDRTYFRNVNGILTSNESPAGCLRDTSCFVSSEEACTICETEVTSNFWTSCNLKSWLQIWSTRVTQTSVVHCFVFINPKSYM